MLTRLISSFLGRLDQAKHGYRCPVCGSKPATFLPLPEYFLDNARLHGFPHSDNAEMLSLKTYSCSKCGASDRERLYALWIDQQLEKNVFHNNARVIHFAPEPALSSRLRRLKKFDYVTADLLMDSVDLNVDMMEMSIDDETVDFFICSHVLEHVPSDDQALKELYRVCKSGASGILMVPIILGLEGTLEDPAITNEADRWRLYGQGDHVRLYARDDYIRKVRSHGFQVNEFGEDYFGEEIFRNLGLSKTSVLYVANK